MQHEPPAKRRKTSHVTSSHLSRLIGLKVQCDLSKKQLQHVLDLYHPGESEFLSKLLTQQFRVQKQCKGVICYRLHGCVTCDSFIWSHSEHMPCPHCGNQDGRYGESGDPLQEVFYFPVLPQLESMYRNIEWRKTLEYPEKRPIRRDGRSRSDIFDGTEYRRLRSDVECEHFVVLSYCADAIPADKHMKRSVLPGILSVQNYDPRLRFKSINMMLTLLLPPHISTKSAHKFYSFLEDELNELYEIGVDNGKLKGIDLYVVNHYR